MTDDSELRPCCLESTCPRADIISLLAPNDPIENDIDQVASTLAHRCGVLDRQGLEYCFTRTFEMPTECRLFDRFCSAYTTERKEAATLPAGGPQ